MLRALFNHKRSAPRAGFSPCQTAGNAARRSLRITRKRGGFSLIESALVLMLAVVVGTQLIQIASVYARQRAAQLDARYLSDLAQAGRSLVLGQAQSLAVGGALELTPAQLEALGVLDPGVSAQSATGRIYTVTALRRSANEVVILARGAVPAGEPVFMDSPKGGEGIDRVGLIHSQAPDFLRGLSLNYDLSWMTGGFASAKPVVGDLVALDVVRRDQSILPYLHRTENVLFPELNRMETDLDMGGHDVDNISSLQAVQLNLSQGLQAARLTGVSEIAGTLQSGALTVTGAAEVVGDMTVVGKVDAGSAVVSGRLSANTLEASSAQVTGDMTSSTASAGSITATTAGLRHLESDLITARQIMSSGRGDFQNLSTGSCTGC
jgi:hypothetical protein